MSTNKAIRADDASGLSIATVQLTEDAISKDFQAIVLNDPTTAANKAAVTGSGALKVDNSGVTQPVSIAGTVNVRPSDGTNPITSNFDVDSGAGTQYVLGFSLRKSASGGSVEYGTSSDPVRVDPTGTTAQPITDNSGSLTVDAPVGTPVAVRLSDGSAFLTTSSGALKVDGSAVTQPVSGTVTANPGNTANTTPWLITQVPGTSGGDSVSHLISAASTNATNVKASAGQVFGWSIFNTNAATRYVKLHNSTGTPTAGSGVVYTIAVPPSGGSNLSIPDGLAFSTGIAFTAVTGTADSDSTGVGANDLVINIHYK